MFDITIGAALIAGVLSFFSPCVLPIVPGYIGYLGSLSNHTSRQDQSDAKKTKTGLFMASIFFVAGFVSVFMLIGASTSMVSTLFAQYIQTFQIIAGAVIFFLGLHFIGWLPIGFLNRDIRFMPQSKFSSPVGGYIVGLAFGFGWTPCVGPVLATIFLSISSSASADSGMMLLLAYGLGIGVPFIIVALFADLFIQNFSRLRRSMHLSKLVLGGLMMLTGIAMITGMLNDIGYYMLRSVSLFSNVG